MAIVGVFGIAAIIICLFVFIHYKDKYWWQGAKWLLIGSMAGVSFMVALFEIIWFCMYLGLSIQKVIMIVVLVAYGVGLGLLNLLTLGLFLGFKLKERK